MGTHHIVYSTTEDADTSNGTNVASFFVALQKLSTMLQPKSSIKIKVWLLWSQGHADRYKTFVNRIPRDIEVEDLGGTATGATTTFQTLLQLDTVSPTDTALHVTSAALLMPEALGVCLEAAQKHDYVSGHDSNIADQASKITFAGGRHWRSGFPVGACFAAKIGTLLEDAELLNKFGLDAELAWATLVVLKQRTLVTPMPAVWAIQKQPAPPAVPWEQVQQFVIKNAF